MKDMLAKGLGSANAFSGRLTPGDVTWA